MRHKKYTFKIGRTSSHRRALLANQVCSLIYSSVIKTTIAKAKETRRVADKMVTLAKKNNLHCRRRAIGFLGDVNAVKILFNEIAPQFINRNGGYTSIHRYNKRLGDSAEMCLLKWVLSDNEKKQIEDAKTKNNSTKIKDSNK